MIDERAYAGGEHLDPEYVEGYDRKTGFDVETDVALLRGLGLDEMSTLVDLGAGTGMLERARARGGVEVVEAGFLSYVHEGDPPQFVYSRNALHHLPDYWKGIALARMHDLLAPGGTLVLRDIVYSFEAHEAEEVLERWYAAAPADPRDGWTRAELEAHVANEHSTFSWLLEPLLEHAGFEIRDAWYAESRTYARYI